MLRKAYFVGDLTRPNKAGGYLQRLNAAWFSGLFEPHIRCCGFATSTPRADLNGLSFPDFFQALLGDEPKPSLVEAAAALYDIDHPVIDEVMSKFMDGIIFGFEMSPSLMRSIHRLGGTYVSFRVHPVRFAGDLIFAACSNDPVIDAYLRASRLDIENETHGVSIIGSYWRRRSKLSLEPGSVIFIGQTSIDTTVILNGRFFTFEDIPQELLSLMRESPTYCVPHPYDRENSILQRIMAACAAVETRVSLYEILAVAPSDATFVTISSGGGREAEEFGHRVIFLSDENYGKNSHKERTYHPQSHRIFTTRFWRDLFEGRPGRPGGDLSPPFLRETIGKRWGYPLPTEAGPG